MSMNLEALGKITSTPVTKPAKPRDRGDLIDLDLSSSVQYREHSAASVPSANESSLSIQIRLPSGELVNGCRLLLKDLKSLSVHDANPRKSDPTEISTLVRKIIETNGNITPVVCRKLKNGNIELIAGTRRLRASIEAGTLLLADVITDEISEQMCESIAIIENSERDDPDVWSYSRNYYARYNLVLKDDKHFSVEAFGKLYNISRNGMSEYLNLAKIPFWLVSLTDRYIVNEEKDQCSPAWSYNMALSLKRAVNGYRENNHDDEHYSSLKKLIGHHHYKSAKELIKSISALSSSDAKVNIKTKDLVHDGAVVGSMSIGKRKKTIDLRISEDAPDELKQALHALLAKYGVSP